MVDLGEEVGGPMGPPYAKMKGTMMIERSYDPSFALALARKDAGHGESDMAAVVEAGRE